jgi:hypothetical protein
MLNTTKPPRWDALLEAVTPDRGIYTKYIPGLIAVQDHFDGTNELMRICSSFTYQWPTKSTASSEGEMGT